MLPVITIVGRPNVGKSTLFNALTDSRDALVADMPGVTRDRQYGLGMLGDQRYWVVDTGGLAEPDDPEMTVLTDQQVHQAIEDADLILLLVDAEQGLTSADREIARQLQAKREQLILVVNKVDREQAEVACSDFYQLGFPAVQAVAAKSGRGVRDLVKSCLARCPQDISEEEAELESEWGDSIRMAVIGRPNVGKSTLVNRLLGEDRVVVCDRPGTTRDSVYIPYKRREQSYVLIDTAGIRRRAKITDTIEKFSVIKALQAIEKAHVVINVFNAREGISDQDLKLLGLILQSGKAVVLAFNQWDDMDDDVREQFKRAVDRRLPFVAFARRYFISALHGTGVGHLYEAVQEAYQAASQEIATSELTEVLMKARVQHQPPMVRGRRIKLRYAHVGGHHPLVVVIHGKQVSRLPADYQRYLTSVLRKRFNLQGVPVRLRLKDDDNPYEKS